MGTTYTKPSHALPMIPAPLYKEYSLSFVVEKKYARRNTEWKDWNIWHTIIQDATYNITLDESAIYGLNVYTTNLSKQGIHGVVRWMAVECDVDLFEDSLIREFIYSPMRTTNIYLDELIIV